MSISVFRRVALLLRAWSTYMTPRRGRIVALVALVILVGAAACSEQLDSGSTCSTLCPLQNETLRDTVLDPVSLDTTLAGFPVAGATRSLLLATAPSPDSLDVRALVRFDSLPSKYSPAAGGDSVAITTVDSTYLRLVLDTTGTQTVPLPAAITVEAYDVDTTIGVDTTTATLARLFRPDRRIGSATLAAGALVPDSLRVKLSDAVFAAKATTGTRLRVGLRIVSAQRAQLRVLGVRSGGSISSTAPTLTFDAATDTGYKAVVVAPYSRTPASDPAVLGSLIDQSLVVRSPSPAIGTDLIVGGAPGRRTLIEFKLPIQLTDSTNVVRAVLELTQRPARYVAATDTVRIRSEGVLATSGLTDLVQVAGLAAPIGLERRHAQPLARGQRHAHLFVSHARARVPCAPRDHGARDRDPCTTRRIAGRRSPVLFVRGAGCGSAPPAPDIHPPQLVR